jgi:hypothetical protein
LLGSFLCVFRGSDFFFEFEVARFFTLKISNPIKEGIEIGSIKILIQ